jgi:hypothetical protein
VLADATRMDVSSYFSLRFAVALLVLLRRLLCVLLASHRQNWFGVKLASPDVLSLLQSVRRIEEMWRKISVGLFREGSAW